MLRLFFALLPKPAQSEALVLEAAPLAVELGSQTVPARNLHATLCFVGAVEPEKLDAVRAVGASIRGRHVNLTFDALENWDSPRILCATAPSDAEHFATVLARTIGESLMAAGFAPDIKPLRAHLTLARKISSVLAAKHEWPRRLAAPLMMRCEEFVLMQSRRDETGSVYSAVDSWPLYE